MTRSVVGVLLAIGALIGFFAGRAYQVAARAWQDYRKTKEAVPVLLRAWWAAVRAAVLIVVLALLYFVGSIGAAAVPGAHPSPVPSVSRSPR